MKRTIIILCVLLMTVAAVFAQQEVLNKAWTNGDIQYTGEREGRMIRFSGFDGHEGGFGFALGEPTNGKMLISETSDGLGYSNYLGCMAEYKRIGKQELLIIKDKAGKHIDVLVAGERYGIITSALVRFLAGSYRDVNGKGYVFSADGTRASGFGAAEENYTIDEAYYLPDFIICIGNNSYMIVKERQENGLRLRFEPYAKNSEDDWAPAAGTSAGGASGTSPAGTVPVQPLMFIKTAWIGDAPGGSIPGRYPFTSTEVMTWRDLMMFSLDELDIMRNEIFARYGHTFKTARYRDYFSAQPWYKATTNDATNLLKEIEQLNIAQIVMVQDFIKNAN